MKLAGVNVWKFSTFWSQLVSSLWAPTNCWDESTLKWLGFWRLGSVSQLCTLRFSRETPASATGQSFNTARKIPTDMEVVWSSATCQKLHQVNKQNGDNSQRPEANIFRLGVCQQNIRQHSIAFVEIHTNCSNWHTNCSMQHAYILIHPQPWHNQTFNNCEKSKHLICQRKHATLCKTNCPAC